MSSHRTRWRSAAAIAICVVIAGCGGAGRSAPFTEHTQPPVNPPTGPELPGELPTPPASPQSDEGPQVTAPEGVGGPLTGNPGPLRPPELPDSGPLPAPNIPTTAPVGAMPSVPAATEGHRIPARVVRVVDGDTFIITGPSSGERRLRVIGYDTPEIHSGTVECYGQEATRLAEQLVGGKPILLEADPTQPAQDAYGRVLAHVYTNDNRLLGEVMIRAGAAVEMTVGAPHRHQGTYRAAEAAARTERVGQWATC